jgi:PEGA domain
MIRARKSSRRFAPTALLIGFLAGPVTGCAQNVGRAAVTLRLQAPTKQTPRDASVIIDEEYVAPLWLVAARGVRLPVGTHRITVQKEGYFPWDKQVTADRLPITLDVELVPIPD